MFARYMLFHRVIKQLMKVLATWNNALFRDRKIVIISDKNIISIPLSQRFQQISLFAVVGMLTWSAYSSGRFVAYQGIIAQKEIEVIRSNMENQELQQLYDSMHGEMQSMNGFLDEIKKATQTAPSKQKAPDKQSSNITSDGLNKQMAKLRLNMEQKLLKSTARLEKTIAGTGLDLEPILAQRKLWKLRQAALQGQDKTGMGGPYIPIRFSQEQTPTEDMLKARTEYLIALSALMKEIPLGKPINSNNITSGFGKRRDPFTGHSAMHEGLDFVGAYGANIYATAAGKVTKAGRFAEYGNFVEIRHGNGISTRYGHLKEVLAREGQKVERGTIIGTQGNTGRSTGTHLHYEVRINDEARNPMSFVTAGE